MISPQMRDPSAPALRSAGFELVETHISRVFLGTAEVFKIKRPVDLGFLDFTTLARREVACRAEVELNRRLAPDVYLGVVPVTRGADGERRFGGAGEVVDWAVHMRRLPDADRADQRLRDGRLSRVDLDHVAVRLAAFHAAARTDDEIARFGTPAAIADNVDENFDQTRGTIGRYLEPGEAAEIERWQHAFLAERAALLTARVSAGRVRDGHGDLRLEHVYLSGASDSTDAGVTIIDCIEFNRRFRYGDVAADVAFLAMDLAWHGRVDLAEHFLARYARAAQDFGLYSVIAFYESYRAFVRGKVAAMLADDAEVSADTRERARAEARRYFLLALACGRRPLVEPMLVAVGGVIASGKSTLAEILATRLGAPIIDSDRTRKHLLGVAPEHPVRPPAFAGAYRPEVSRQVYGELRRRAAAVLASGRPAILDASFHDRAERLAAQALAAEHGVSFVFVECRAPEAVLRERLAARPDGPSDGRLEILDDFLARWQPVNELPRREHRVIDTTRPVTAQLAWLRAELPDRPREVETVVAPRDAPRPARSRRPAGDRGFTLLETLVALALLGVGMLMTLALFAQEPRLARRVEAHGQALAALDASLEAARSGHLTHTEGVVDLEPLGFVAPPAALAVHVELSALSPPGLGRLVLVASYVVDGRRFERRVETLLWRPS